ncbi:DUF2470 domain-containing protein [Polymorphospora rubra]|uniref:DUF2470 domain-containing protein n=1 Tax=Polymorphospora rubra TaxID=338584 RepID=A0A810MQY4_9ACTN|nr:DUF2470 domain-containing protein [Polymorphospora rubra]BCJ63322.1 hypothetical protein Prubr_03430 [Polymorphospora rubra]
MQPSPAEVARTLAAGRLAGTAHVACRPGPHPVRHVTDPSGRLLLLTRAGTLSANALHPSDGADDVAVVLDVPDVPPVTGSPSLGRVWISGWATELTGAAAVAAAVDYAAVDPTGDLLDVGRGMVLHRVDVAEIRLERAGTMIDIDPDDYAEAEPDPLRDEEGELLADLGDHHVTEMAGFIRRQLRGAGHDHRPDHQPQVVRLDRYGFVVAIGPPGSRYCARLTFPRPVADRADLAKLLHPVLCHRCGERAPRR